MVRKSLIVAALVAAATPLSAQNGGEMIWSSDRPDADVPLSVYGARTLDAGDLQLGYRWMQRNYQGVWFGKDSLGLAATLQLYQVAPLSLSDRRHTVTAAYGVTDRLTVSGHAEFVMLEREQLRSDGVYYITSASALGDVHADATFNLIRTGPYRFDVSAGAVIPVGSVTTRSVTPFSTPATEITPYDMRPGAGSFGVSGAASADVQNEYGSVGGQVRFLTYVNENSRNFTLGDRYEANVWAAYRANDAFSGSIGFRWEKWGNIDGEDAELALITMRDPMNDAVFLSGLRAGMPLTINFVAPDGTFIAGHKISIENFYALHHDYDGPQIGLDWGLNLGYTMPF